MADTFADHARLTGGLVGAGLGDGDEQLTGGTRADVLDLADHASAVGVDVELGDLLAVVGDLQVVVAGGGVIGVDVTGAVIGGDGEYRGVIVLVGAGDHAQGEGEDDRPGSTVASCR